MHAKMPTFTAAVNRMWKTSYFKFELYCWTAKPSDMKVKFSKLMTMLFIFVGSYRCNIAASKAQIYLLNAWIECLKETPGWISKCNLTLTEDYIIICNAILVLFTSCRFFPLQLKVGLSWKCNFHLAYLFVRSGYVWLSHSIILCNVLWIKWRLTLWHLSHVMCN